MAKKILKWTGISFVVLLLLLIMLPIIFKGKIQELVLKSINENVRADVGLEEFQLSLLKNFPKATVGLHGLSIVNQEPFAGDTLFYAETIELRMSVWELFKKGEPMEVKSFLLKNAKINVLVNEDGIANYDIALQKDEEVKEDESTPFSLKMNSYKLENIFISYADKKLGVTCIFDELNHSGTGDLANQVLDLTTETTTLFSLHFANVSYFKKTPVVLTAVLGIDMESQKYTFKENALKLNELTVNFDGFVQLKEEGPYTDIRFNTPNTSFANALNLVPSAYSGPLDQVKTNGNFILEGFAKGLSTETEIPTFGLKMMAENASVKYPNLPQSITDIDFHISIINASGKVDETHVDVSNFAFTVDKDRFISNGKFTQLTTNPHTDAALKGTINLANLHKAYPVSTAFPVKGVLNLDMQTRFAMSDVELEKYENIYTAGTVQLTDFEYKDAEANKKYEIRMFDLQFDPKVWRMKNFDFKTGQSDVRAQGSLENVYGYFFKKQLLKGALNVNAKEIHVLDFLSPEPEATTKETTQTASTTAKEPLKIPANIEFNIQAVADKVVYDKMTLSKTSGKLVIKDESVQLQQIKAQIFDGTAQFDGKVSTKSQANFDMLLQLQNVDIAQTLSQMESLKKVAPVVSVLNGRMTTKVQFEGPLDPIELTPDMQKLNGTLLGLVLDAKVNASNSKMLQNLDNQFAFIDFEKLQLKQLKADMTFENGNVVVKPIDLSYQDIPIKLSGRHGFDQSMNYQFDLQVPVKYLGNEVNQLLNRLSPNEAARIKSVPVIARVTGTFGDPKVTTDLSQVAKNVANQIIAQQKEALINKGSQALQNMLPQNMKGKDSTAIPIPTTKEEVKQQIEEKAKDKVKEGLNNLINRPKRN